MIQLPTEQDPNLNMKVVSVDGSVYLVWRDHKQLVWDATVGGDTIHVPYNSLINVASEIARSYRDHPDFVDAIIDLANDFADFFIVHGR